MNRTSFIRIRVNSEEARAFDRLARVMGVTVSDMVRRLVNERLVEKDRTKVLEDALRRVLDEKENGR